MANTITFRKLKPEEIELRVGATTESGFSLLLYKTARVDANILDETVGAFNWQKRFYQVKNTMICEVAIYFEDRKEWVSKGDAGDESNTEAIKGEASDSFKRAGFAWGIGRELYTSPFIWITKDANNDPKKSHYSVKEIEYRDNEISKLVITNDKTGQVVFSKGASKNYSQTTEKTTQNSNEPITKEDVDFITSYIGQLNGDSYKAFFDWLEKNFGTREFRKLNAEQGKIVSTRLKRK